MTISPKDNTTGKGMVLTDRDRQIVTAVGEFGILSRVQLARHLRFGSVTRANAVLLRLTRHGYLTRRLQPSLQGTRRQTYLLGLRGAELLAGARDQPRTARRRWREASDLFVEHRLLVNDIRLGFQQWLIAGYAMRTWTNETALRNLNLGVIPDGYCEYDLRGKSFAVFVEADNGTETRARWRQKTTQYLDLAMTGRFHALFHRQYFRVLVVVPSPRRLESLLGEIARQTKRLFWLTTSNALVTAGPFGPIWYRPDGTAHQSLTL